MANKNEQALKEELTKLQRLNHEKTVRLRQLGIDLDADLPVHFAESLNEYVAIQQETRLLDLGETQLEQWYQDRKLDAINVFECVSEGLSQCSHLKQRLDGVNAEIERIKAQLEVAEREFPQSAESDRTKQKLDDEIARQSFKLQNMQKLPDDIHLVDIMEKDKELKIFKTKIQRF